jgi:hypothetical protein
VTGDLAGGEVAEERIRNLRRNEAQRRRAPGDVRAVQFVNPRSYIASLGSSAETGRTPIGSTNSNIRLAIEFIGS